MQSGLVRAAWIWQVLQRAPTSRLLQHVRRKPTVSEYHLGHESLGGEATYDIVTGVKCAFASHLHLPRSEVQQCALAIGILV